jgi:hypothetical protein
VQWTGGQASLSQENVLGCSRFTSDTAVGPTTSGSTLTTSGSAITWTLPRSSIGGAGLADLTATFGDTWFRGVSACCPGSTTNSQYLWNQADRGPDSGVWEIAYSPTVQAPPAPTVTVAITAVANRTAAPPGGFALYQLNVTATGAANMTFQVDGLNWTVQGLDSWDGRNATAGDAMPGGNRTLRDLVIEVPADAPNGTVAFEVHALLAGNVTARLELVLDVDPTAAGFSRTTPDDGADNEAVDEADTAEQSPGPGLVVVMAGLAAAVHAVRRRR